LPSAFSKAIEQLTKNVALNIQALLNTQPKKIAWGAKVPAEFKLKAIQVATNLGVSPDFLMACMAFETGETFSPSIKMPPAVVQQGWFSLCQKQRRIWAQRWKSSLP
jgi:hypothetical protein